MDADSDWKTATDKRKKRDASTSRPSRCKIDVGRYVAEMEHTLRANRDRSACLHALAILQRWQFDEMLEDASSAARGTARRELRTR